MLETLNDYSQWSSIAAYPSANIATDTTNHVQGSAGTKFDKTATSSAYSGIQRKRAVPQNLRPWRGLGLSLTVEHYHANYTNVDAFIVRLVYRYDASGVADRWEDYRSASPGAGANQDQVSLDSPTSTSGTPPTDEEKTNLVGVEFLVEMGAAANTITGVSVSALYLASASASLLEFDGERLMLPTFDVWNRAADERTAQNQTQTAAETFLVSRKQSVQFGTRQVRQVYNADWRVHPEEEALAIFSEHAGSANGWGVAYRCNELVNTTADGAATAGATTIDAVSVLDINLLGPAGVELRIGPNDSRQTERVRVLGESSGTLTLARPLRYAHESGTPIRSMDYYPSCAKSSNQPALQETGTRVSLDCKAVETS